MNAWSFVDIDGWRIGVAVFPERVYLPPPPRPIYPDDRGRGGPGSEDTAPRAQTDRRAEGKASAAPASGARAFEGGPGAQSAPAPQRPGLGTEFGESVTSHIREVSFVRANPAAPSLVLGLRYNDRPGLLAVGVDVDGPAFEANDAWLRGTAEPFPVSRGRYAAPPAGWRR